MDFREINKDNYWDCINLSVSKSQEHFVADNKQSLIESFYEDGLYPLGIYDQDIMIGFLLYDYDKSYPGWSLSRFMIGKQYQGKGYGKKALNDFVAFFKNKHKADTLYISVSLDNEVALKMYKRFGFKEVKEIEYDFLGSHYKEMQMVLALA